MKTRGGVVKNLLRQAGRGHLPDEILFRRKSPYPKTYDTNYEALLVKRVREMAADSNAPVMQFLDRKKLERFLLSPSDYGRPWYGQLMAGPQMLAYILQVNFGWSTITSGLPFKKGVKSGKRRAALRPPSFSEKSNSKNKPGPVWTRRLFAGIISKNHQTITEKGGPAMRVTGVIAEYNPFHGGHQYQIARAKELSGADYCVVAMSGDFVQRGEPAVYSKYLRARAALACGADLVLEIPSLFATGQRRGFRLLRRGAALRTGHGGHPLFRQRVWRHRPSSQSGPVSDRRFRGIRGPDEGRYQKRSHLPAARSRALKTLGVLDPDTIALIESPNNLLGLEYCRALLVQNSALTPLAVLRLGNA